MWGDGCFGVGDYEFEGLEFTDLYLFYSWWLLLGIGYEEKRSWEEREEWHVKSDDSRGSMPLHELIGFRCW